MKSIRSKRDTIATIGALCLLIGLTYWSIKPLLSSGFFNMHDDQQVVRLFELNNALKAGQFPVRWVSNLGFGYGYPLFVFYPPLVYYFGEIFHLMGFSLLASIKIVFAAAFLLSAVSMFFYAKHHFGTLSAVVAGLFYTYAPYRAVDAYVRGALAELFAFVWLPLILLAIDKVFDSNAKTKDRRIWGPVLSLSYAGLMLTHNLIFLPFSLLIGCYLIIRLGFQKVCLTQRLKLMAEVIFYLFLGFGLTTFFWLPALYEKQFSLVDQILLTEKYSYWLHYVEPMQLWNSLWGYGGSAPPGEIDGFTLKIGKLHVILAVVAFILALITKMKSKLPQVKVDRLEIIISAFVLFFAAAFLTTKASSLVWDILTPLQYLQFPWRFLTFTALFSSFLAGAFYYQVSLFIPHRFGQYGLLMIIGMLLFVPNLKLFTPQTRLDVDDAYYLSDEFLKWYISGTSFEFVPKGVATRVDEVTQITQLDLERSQVATSSFNVVEGTAEARVLREDPHRRLLAVKADTPSIFRFNTFNFPGWTAWVNDSAVEINDDNRLKLIDVWVPQGEHRVEIVFKNTPTRELANVISVVFLVIIVAYLFRDRKFYGRNR